MNDTEPRCSKCGHKNCDCLLSAIDRVKPLLQEDEVLCSGCWKVAKHSEATGSWSIYRFTYLDTVILCPECHYKCSDDFDKIFKAGL